MKHTHSLRDTIIGFEDTHPDVLEEVLTTLFPDLPVEVHEEFHYQRLDYALALVTDMMMPVAFKARDLEYAGVSPMLYAQRHGVLAVCTSSLDHHDRRCNFGNHLLRQAGMEMIDNVDKSDPEAWKAAIIYGFASAAHNALGRSMSAQDVPAYLQD